MAQLTVDGDTLVYELSFREKFATMSWFSKPIMIPLAQVRSASLVAQAYEILWGGYDPANPLVPDPGALGGTPNFGPTPPGAVGPVTTTNNSLYGLFGPKGSRTLAAVRRGGPSIQVELYDTSGLSFNRLVVTVPDPQSAVAAITTALANRRQVLGEDHPEAQMVRDNVAVAQEAPRVAETQAPPGQAQKALPRFDGLYRAEGGAYLRFTSSGEVYSVTSTGTAEQVARWLGPGKRGLSRGTYTVRGREISFTAAGEEGRIDYSGQISSDAVELKLNIYSHINGHRSERIYLFAPIK